MNRKKGPDEIFCRSCGVPIKEKAEICPNCGVANEYRELHHTGQHSQTTNQWSSRQTGGREAGQQQQPARDQSATPNRHPPPRSVEHDPSSFTTNTSEKWYYGVAVSVVLWVVGFGLPDAAGGAFFLMAWVLMPVSIYYDQKWLRATTRWNPQLPLWVILSVIPLVNIVAGAVYLVRRYNVSQVSSPDMGGGNGQRNADSLAQLKDRYSRGELTDEEFERKVEQIVATEDRETAKLHTQTQREE